MVLLEVNILLCNVYFQPESSAELRKSTGPENT